MLPADDDAVLRSTAAPAWDDDVEVEEGLEEDAAEEVDALLVAAVAGLLFAGEVPVLLPQPVRAAARARIASPARHGGSWCAPWLYFLDGALWRASGLESPGVNPYDASR